MGFPAANIFGNFWGFPASIKFGKKWKLPSSCKIWKKMEASLNVRVRKTGSARAVDVWIFRRECMDLPGQNFPKKRKRLSSLLSTLIFPLREREGSRLRLCSFFLSYSFLFFSHLFVSGNFFLFCDFCFFCFFLF